MRKLYVLSGSLIVRLFDISNVFAAVLICCSHSFFAANCTFNGNGNGSSWTDAGNWSCNHAPNPASDNVIIPAGFSVVNNTGGDFGFENDNDLTIHGTLDMNGSKIEMKHNSSLLTVSSTGTLTDVGELFFVNDSDGLFEFGASVDIQHLKVDDNSELSINARCITVTDKLENLSSAGIIGTGCITYNGSTGNFVNTGSDGIFGCTSNSQANCSPLDGGGNIVPIELLSFTAKVHDKDVLLEWSTASEQNNDFFLVERSDHLKHWKVIGKIEGAGTSSSIRNYSLWNNGLNSGTYYYRLLQQDFDGQYSYSPVRSVDIGKLGSTKISVFPNPVSDQIVIEGEPSDLVAIRMYNLRGEDITSSLEMISIDDSKMVMRLIDLPAGIYAIKTKAAAELVYKQ